MTIGSSGLRTAAALALVASLCIAAPAPAARRLPGRGPFGGTVTGVDYSPHDPSVVLATTAHGVFRSVDGGATWTRSRGLGSYYEQGVLFHPSKPDVVAMPDGRYRSADGGRTWSPALGNVEFNRATGVGFGFGAQDREYSIGYLRLILRDHRPWRVIHDIRLSEGQFCGLRVIQRSSGDVLYVGVIRGASRETIRSDDGGATWQSTQLQGCHPLFIDEHNPLTVYQKTDDGLLKSTDGGTTTRVLSNITVEARDVEVSSDSSSVIFAVGGGKYGGAGVERSLDGGDTWQRLWSTRWGATDIDIDPSDPETLLVGTHEGMWKTVDGTAFAPSQQGLEATTPRFLAFSPVDPATALVTSESSVHLTTDAGATWRDVGSTLAGEPTEESRYGGVAIDAGGMLYAAVSGGSSYQPRRDFYRSSNGGVTWERASEAAVGEVLAHPTVSGFLLAGSAGGLLVSTDAGTSWRSTPLPPHAIFDIAMDEANGAVYVLTSTPHGVSPPIRGLYRSDTFGAQWTQFPYPPFPQSSSLAVRGGTIVTADEAASQIAKTTDDGATWETHELMAAVGSWPYPTQVEDIALDPLDTNQIALATRSFGLLWSRDGGKSWTQYRRASSEFSGIVEFFPVAAAAGDPLPERPLFAGIGGVWRIVPGPNPEHPARLRGAVRAGNVVRCVTGQWSRTETVKYAWFNGDGKRYRGADRPTFRVPRPGDGGWDVACRATGIGPGGRHRTRSPVSGIHT